MSTEQYPRNSKIERVPSGQIERVNIERALNFLRETCYGEMKHPESPVTEGLVKMNLEHSERVRKNAVEIARGEGLDEDLLEIAAILHDVQKLDHHRRDSGGIDTWHHHHRGAALARKFLLKLNRSGELIETDVIKKKTGKEMSHKYIQQAEEFFRRLENVSNLEEFDKVYEAVMHESV